MNKLKFFRNVIYKLSRNYGFRMALYHTTETIDYQTGIKTVTRVKYPIRKALALPNQSLRDYGYVVGLDENNKLQFGGLLDTKERIVLIPFRELPKGFQIQSTDYIVFRNQRYNLIKWEELEIADYWLTTVKKTQGEPTYQVHERCLRQKIVLNDSISRD